MSLANAIEDFKVLTANFKLNCTGAESYCRQHGGHLASIHEESENDFFSQFAAEGYNCMSRYTVTIIKLNI